MPTMLDTLIDFDQAVLRNTVGVNFDFDVFDDLSEESQDWEKAHRLAAENIPSQFLINDVEFNAVEYIFACDTWVPSRFGNGTFPVWYGSLELETTFFETGFHWKRTLLADAGFLNSKTPIYAVRTVFKVGCVSALVDLRSKAQDYPFLVQTDANQYQPSQNLGLELFEKGLPGLLTPSARKQLGTNVAVFNKRVLRNPTYFDDYLYEISPQDQYQIKVSRMKTREVIAAVG